MDFPAQISGWGLLLVHTLSTSAYFPHRTHSHVYCIQPCRFVLAIAHGPIHPCSNPKFNMELKKSTELMTYLPNSISWVSMRFNGFQLISHGLPGNLTPGPPGRWETSKLEIEPPLKAPRAGFPRCFPWGPGFPFGNLQVLHIPSGDFL